MDSRVLYNTSKADQQADEQTTPSKRLNVEMLIQYGKRRCLCARFSSLHRNRVRPTTISSLWTALEPFCKTYCFAALDLSLAAIFLNFDWQKQQAIRAASGVSWILRANERTRSAARMQPLHRFGKTAWKAPRTEGSRRNGAPNGAISILAMITTYQ